ncbi:MAG: DUF2339 domain-containing protein [Gammaproteobacteria bacterium]|nr:MAG: DUF2339 domain-containing protein [Gammaproteobacteria bacterium]
MHIVLPLIIGLIIGAAASGVSGAFLGMILGGCLGAILRLSVQQAESRTRLGKMQQQLEILQARVIQLSAKDELREKAGKATARAAAPVDSDTVAVSRVPLAERLGSLEVSESVASGELPDAAPARFDAKPVVEQVEPESAPEPGPVPSPSETTTTPQETPTLSGIAEWLSGTNMVARVGVLILFLGVGFLIKYAVENFSVSPQLRLLGISAAAAFLYWLSGRMDASRQRYALLLKGAAIGIWYLVSYAAFRVYPLISPATGFMLMGLLSLFSAWRAVTLDALVLAVFGILGGFLAPILASTGTGSHVVLFSYYAVLNTLILLIVWHKAWRSLALMGFLFTFVIGVIWGVTKYQAAYFASTEPFLLLFILMYVAMTLVFTLRKQWEFSQQIDGAILFGTPAIGFSLQSALVNDFDNGRAWSALGFGLFYLLVSMFWNRALKEKAPLVRESFFAISAIFLTLAIPFAFDNSLTATLWSLEGAAALWLAVRQHRHWAAVLAIVVQVGAGLSWLMMESHPDGARFLLNTGTFNCFLVALAGFSSAWVLRFRAKGQAIAGAQVALLVWALLWWLGGALWQVSAHYPLAERPTAWLWLATITLVLVQRIERRWEWIELLPALLLALPASLVIAAVSMTLVEAPSLHGGWLAWAIFLIALHSMLRQQYSRGLNTDPLAMQHGLSFMLAMVLLVWDLSWRASEWTSLYSWRVMAMGVGPMVLLFLVNRIRWWHPDFDKVYRLQGSSVAALLLYGTVLGACLVRPEITPWPYIPLLNPLDAFQWIAIGLLYSWQSSPLVRDTAFWRHAPAVLSVVVFVCLNALLLRVLHVIADIPFDWVSMVRSMLVQTCVSIFWAVLGVLLMVSAKRQQSRQTWMAGMLLLGMVVVKLFAVDLANSGSIERIVSFVGVGLLLLGVGYLSPLPDANANRDMGKPAG